LVDTRALADEVRENVHARNQIIKDSTLDWHAVYDQLLGYGEQMRRWTADVSLFLATAMREGRRILFEGAQATMLDIDHGTYPYVTSSNATIGGVCTGLGVPPRAIGGVLGVAKAYTTRVGEGPLPTELFGDMAERLRESGQEYGASTGRPRRCGWYDAVVVRYAVRVNGLDALALTKLDVLDELAEIPVCVAYKVDGATTRELPSRHDRLERAEPVFEVLPGWRKPTVGVLDESDLPREAREYVDFLEREVGAEIGLISTGPRREETILRDNPLLAGWTGGRLPQVIAERHGG
jgi:adenylosuccinate synthase